MKSLPLRHVVDGRIELTEVGKLYARCMRGDATHVDAPKGYEFTGEFRVPQDREPFLRTANTDVGWAMSVGYSSATGLSWAILEKIPPPVPDKVCVTYQKSGPPRRLLPGDVYWAPGLECLCVYNSVTASADKYQVYKMITKEA